MDSGRFGIFLDVSGEYFQTLNLFPPPSPVTYEQKNIIFEFNLFYFQYNFKI
jgi:hypothetical protein